MNGQADIESPLRLIEGSASHLFSIAVSGTRLRRRRGLTLREVLKMPLPEPDPPDKPQPDSVEGRTAAYRTSPTGGVVTWEIAPSCQASLEDAIKQFADTAEDTDRR